MKSLIVLMILMTLGFSPQGKSETARKKIYKELGLSHAQARSLFVVRKKKQIRLKGLKKELKTVQRKINRALMEDKSDKVLQKWHRKKIILQAKIKQERFNSTLSIRKVLSKRQRKSYLELKKKLSAKAAKNKSLSR